MASKNRVSATPRGKTDECAAKARNFEKWLLSPDPAERNAAIKQIEKATCPEKKIFLMRSLMHDDSKIRKTVSHILGKMKEEVTNEDIIDMNVFLNSKDPKIRFDIIDTMSRLLSEDSAHTVSELLSAHLDQEEDMKNIRLAVKILWSIESVNKENRSFSELINFIEYEDKTIQDATIRAIGRYSSLLTIEELSQISNLLDDEDREKQVNALEALMHIDRPLELASTLMKFFDTMEEREPSTILLALEVLGSMRRYEPIEDFLVGMQSSTDPKYNDFRIHIDEILAQTMRFTPYSPSDALIKKERMEEAGHDLFFQIMEEKPLQEKA